MEVATTPVPLNFDGLNINWAQKINKQLPRSIRPQWFVFWGNWEQSVRGWYPPPLGGTKVKEQIVSRQL